MPAADRMILTAIRESAPATCGRVHFPADRNTAPQKTDQGWRMVAPSAVRDVVAAAGALLVLGTVVSVVGTVIVPRKSGSRLTRLVASAVNRIFGLIVWP